jgi:hypothetical protein
MAWNGKKTVRNRKCCPLYSLPFPPAFPPSLPPSLPPSSRSPIYSHFAETVTGVTTVRAFGAQERFIDESHAKVRLSSPSLPPLLFPSFLPSLLPSLPPFLGGRLWPR